MKPKALYRNLGLGAVLLGTCLFFFWQNPLFLGPRNLSEMAIEWSLTAMLAIAMLLVILPGHIDLSVGSGLALVGGVAAVLITRLGWPAPVALCVAGLMGVALWFGMGSLIVKGRLPAFIITLGGMLLFRGLHWRLTGSQTIPVTVDGSPNLYSLLTTARLDSWVSWGVFPLVWLVTTFWLWRNFRQTEAGVGAEGRETFFLRQFLVFQLMLLFVILMNRAGGVPFPVFLLFVVAGLVHITLAGSVWGRYLYAIGGNEQAAHLAGVNVGLVTTIAFAGLGLITSIAGFLQTAYVGVTTTSTGEYMELDAIAACVVGGASLKGGRGSVAGVLFGSLIMASLSNGMNLLAVEPYMKLLVLAIVLILAVFLDNQTEKRNG